MSTFDVSAIFGERVVSLPEGGVFVSSGFIAPWIAGNVWEFGMNGDLDEITETVLNDTGITIARPGQNGQVLTRATQSGWIWFTASDRETATKIVESLEITDQNGKPQNPQHKWRFEAPLAQVVNLSDEGRQQFAERGRDPFTYAVKHVGVIGHKKGTPYKYQHEFHFVALPAAVAAVADALGYENPGYDLSELLSTDYAPTDDNQARWIGSEGHDYHDSILYQQRKTLWAALGENNPEVVNGIPVVDGVERPDLAGTQGYRKSTGSEKLNKCLEIFTSKWSGPVWGRLQLVTDPRTDACFPNANGDNVHETIPALVELFKDEAEAREVADNDGVEQASQEQAQDHGNGPAVPELYADYADDFKKYVADVKNSPPPVRAKKLDEYGISQKDFEAWAPLV